jgi:CRP-like cAMP-binding protein
MDRQLIELMLSVPQENRHYEPGAQIFREGDAPRGIYFVHRGAVELTFAARDGTAKSLRTADAGETLGLGAVAMNHPHECSAIAKIECEVGFVDRKDFTAALDTSPALWFAVLHLLSRNMNAAYEQIRDMRSVQRGRCGGQP